MRRLASGSGPDRATARAEGFPFIDTFHNRCCLRKSIVFGCITPHETRQWLQNDQTLAAQKKSVQDHGELQWSREVRLVIA